MKSKTSKHKRANQKITISPAWEPVNVHAAGVDIGSREHWACVPAGSSDRPVRQFGTFTADLEALADWFKDCGVTSVAMEATGVYWIPCSRFWSGGDFKWCWSMRAKPRTSPDAKATCRIASGFSGCIAMACSRVPSGRRSLLCFAHVSALSRRVGQRSRHAMSTHAESDAADEYSTDPGAQ